MSILESTCHGILTRLPGVPSANLKPWPWKPTLPNQQRTSVFHGHQTPKVSKRDKDWLWLWCLKILACHTQSFDKTSQHEVVRHGLAGDGIRKWAVLQLQRTTCSVPMSKAIMLQLENRKVHQTHVCSKNDMGPYGFPMVSWFFPRHFAVFIRMFSYQNSYVDHDFKGSAQDAMLTAPPGHVTKIAQHSRRNAYRSAKCQRL